MNGRVAWGSLGVIVLLSLLLSGLGAAQPASPLGSGLAPVSWQQSSSPRLPLATRVQFVPGVAVAQGDVLTVRVLLANPRPVPVEGRVWLTSAPLGIKVVAHYALDARGHTTMDFLFPLSCAPPGPAPFEILYEIASPEPAGWTEQYTLMLVEGDCTPGDRPEFFLETTAQTILQGERARIPFRLVNFQNTTQEYHLALTLTTGTYRIEPSARFTLPPGGVQHGDIILEPGPLGPGWHDFPLQVSVAGNAEAAGETTLKVRVRVLQPAPPPLGLARRIARVALRLLLQLIAITIIIAALLMLFRRLRARSRKTKKEDADFGEYY